MKKPTILHYFYYHCTNKKNPECSQGSIEVKELERQIDQYLSRIQISERFKNWAIKYLKEKNEKEALSRGKILSSQRKAYNNCLRKLDNLFQLKISPLNSNGSLISDEEYAKRKAELIKEKARLEEILNDIGGRVERWLNFGEKTFDSACHARYWFANGTPEEKSQILQALGSNLILKDKKLLIELKKPLRAIGQVVEGVPEAREEFEPEKSGINKLKFDEVYAKSLIVLGELDEAHYLEAKQDFSCGHVFEVSVGLGPLPFAT